MRRKKPALTVLEMFLILLVAFTWLYLYTWAVRHETVWELGRGERPATIAERRERP